MTSGVCDACKNGDHGYHSGPHLARICIGCACEWMPDDDMTGGRERIEQANDVARIVFDEVKRVWPDLHPVVGLRYGIADRLWDAGYRKVGEGS